MDWRHDADYAFCEQLDLAGWAWQFLRREPEYRADFRWFISLWHQLEAEYGAPPQRDFFRWKQDPRAWRAEAEITGCGTDLCPGENDQVLIECWMGAKWGFRKFPIDPTINLPEELAWREHPVNIEVLTPASISGRPQAPEKLALNFDLSLPLPAQLEAAKHQLITSRQLRIQAGVLPPRNVREGASIWRLWLRLLDALEARETLDSIGDTFALTNLNSEVTAARAMCGGGYRRILMLEHLPRSPFRHTAALSSSLFG
jgi:hypothetical protein